MSAEITKKKFKMPKSLKFLSVIIATIILLAFFSASNYILSSTEKVVLSKPILSKKDPNIKLVYGNQNANTLSEYKPTDKEFTIGSGKVVFYAYEGYQNKFKNLAIAFKYLDGYEVKPGETFSYNKAIHLDDPNAIDNMYLEGLGTRSIMPAGGVCSGSTLMATVIKNANLKFTAGPYRHEIYLPEYYRTHEIDGKKVPIVDATVSTYVGADGRYYSAADVGFKNTTDYTLVIRVNGDWDKNPFTPGYPFEKNTQTISITARINIKEAL